MKRTGTHVDPRPEGQAMAFSTRVDVRHGVASIALVGDLRADAVPLLEGPLSIFEGMGVDTIMLDLRDATSMDSEGLGAILAASERAAPANHALILVGTSPALRRRFRVAESEFLLDAGAVVEIFDRFTGGQTRATGHAAPMRAASDA